MSVPLFGAVARERCWEALGGGVWDLLVIGGGATGAAAARDAAGRGLRVALVDAGDFGGGTSSASSRLIHGGLRYLQTGDFRLVFEASAERRRLLALAPHLVRPLPLLFPVFRGGAVGLRTLQAGMWLYDLLALFRNIGRHRMLDRRAALAREPALRREGLRGGALFWDAAVDDARLVVATARAAYEAGAATVSHAEVRGFRVENGAVRGATVRDRLGTRTVEVNARVVLNATGPWTDLVRRLADPTAPPRLRPTKGVHLMLARERLGAHGAVIFRSAVDGRTMFALPWGEQAYVGTTDTDYVGDPGEARAEQADVQYLLASANALFPGRDLGPADVLSSWAGVRPLLAPGRGRAGVAEGKTSREHDVWRDPSGLLNVAGGKLTTFRIMAADAADVAEGILQRDFGVRITASATAAEPLPGAPDGPWDAWVAEAVRRSAALGVPEGTARALAARYGTEVERVLDRVRVEPRLGDPLIPGQPYLWAEVDHAGEAEMALTLADVLQHRLHLFYEAADGGAAVADPIARRMAGLPGIGWDEGRVRDEVARYRARVAENRRPGGSPPG